MGPIGPDNSCYLEGHGIYEKVHRAVAILLPKRCLARRYAGWALRGQTVAGYLRCYFRAGQDVRLSGGLRFAGHFAAMPANAGYRSRKPAGTAFAVGRRHVITAGHCLKDTSPGALYALNELCLVFGYGQRPQSHRYISDAQLIDGAEVAVVAGQFAPGNITVPDGALLRLPRVWAGPGLRLGKPTKVSNGQEIYMVGHRHGLPATITEGHITSDLQRRFPFAFSDLTLFEGQSGSPVFDAATDHVIGWAVGGLPHVGYGMSRNPAGDLQLGPLEHPPITERGYGYQESPGAGVRVMLHPANLPVPG